MFDSHLPDSQPTPMISRSNDPCLDRPPVDDQFLQPLPEHIVAFNRGRAFSENGMCCIGSAYVTPEYPNAADPLAGASTVVRVCPYHRTTDHALFLCFVNGAAATIMDDGAKIVHWHMIRHDPITTKWFTRSNEVDAPKTAAAHGYDLTKPAAEQLDLLKVLAPRPMPDALWLRVATGQPVFDIPPVGADNDTFGAMRLSLLRGEVEHARNPPPAGPTRYVIEDGVEVPEPERAPRYSPEQITEMEAKLLAHDVATAQHDRLLYTYFETIHWLKGVMQAQADHLQGLEQAKRGGASAGEVSADRPT